MKQKNKKNNYKLGSYVEYANGGSIDYTGAITLGGNMLGSIIGGDEGSAISSAASGAAAGTAIAPGIGTLIGGGLGLLGGIIGGNKRRKATKRAFNRNQEQFQENYSNTLESNLDVNNENPYGLTPEFALGGDIDPKTSKSAPKNWMVNYMDSDVYKKRLKKSGQTISKQQRQDLLNTNIVSFPGEYSMAFDKDFTGTLTDPKLNPDINSNIGYLLKKNVPNINISPDPQKEVNDAYKNIDKSLVNSYTNKEYTLAHELSHIQRNLGNSEKVLVSALQKKNKINNEHDENIEEQKADLDALRYMMYKKGIYDTSKRDMTMEDFNNAKKNKEIFNSLYFKRLQKVFDAEGLINFNNFIASNKNNKNIQYAANGGLVDPGDIATGKVKSDDRAYWNGFVDFIDKKGYANSPELDKRNTNLSRKLFDEYNKSNNGGYNYDTFVPAIQTEIANYRNNAINEVKAGRIGVTNEDGSLYKGNIKDYDFDTNYMPGLSNVDGWAGSKTTAWRFPKAYLIENNSTKEIDNPIYAKNKFATGGDVIPNTINIEKDELQIDPNSGEILREYVGINPETGGLYEPHNKKGKDTKNNIVTAEEGSFIVTKKEAKNYKKALDTNDKYHQQSILQNIRNYKKNKETNKYDLGSDVLALGTRKNPLDNYTSSVATTNPLSQGNPNYLGAGLDGITGFLSNYGPSLINMGRGLFGKVDQVNNINPTINPYKSQILANMPQEVSFEPVRQQLLRQQNTTFNQIDNTTSGSPIARANKQNVVANTQTALGKLMMDKQLADNQVRGQRASLYSNLGNQEMNEINRVQGINLNIDDQNRIARATRDNLLSTGLGQLQQTYLNNKQNTRKAQLDQYQVDLLEQMFPSIKPYMNTKFKRNI